MRMDKLTASRMFLFSVALVYLYIIYLHIFPLVPLKILNEPIPILNDKVYQGDNLYYNVSFCKYTDNPCLLRRQLIDGYSFTLPEIEINNPKGCRTQVSSSTIIPKTIPPGRYKLRITAEYKLNIFRTVYVRYETQEFEVLASEANQHGNKTSSRV